MSMPLPMLRDFSDRLTPMLVKEMRQGLRTRFFTLALMLFHLVLITLMLGMAWADHLEDVHEMFRAVIGLTLLVFLPLRGFDALLRESRGGTLDMLRLAGVSSFRLVYGKWAALFSQTLLFVCSILPYMIARYQFGGVEIVAECLALILVVIGSAIITAAYVAYSSVSSIWTRLIAGGVSSLAVWMVSVYCVVITSRFGAPELMQQLAQLQIWQWLVLVVSVLSLTFYSVYVLISLGASRIPDSGENHSTQKRLVALTLHSLLTAVGIVLALVARRGDFGWVFVPALFLNVITSMDVMTEAMPTQPSVVNPFLEGSLWKRMSRWLLYPGWVSGVWFSLLLMLMTMVIPAAEILMYGLRTYNETLLSFVFAVISLTFVPVCFSIRHDNRFVRWWNVQALLALTGGAIIVLVEVTRMKNLAVIGMATPLTSLFAAVSAPHSLHMTDLAVISGCWWLLITCICALRRISHYRELETQALKAANDA